MYSLLRKLLFTLDAERAHELSLKALSLLERLGLLRLFVPARVEAPVRVMGIVFPNAVGLAAGLDKNGGHIDALAQCGFGFVEVGTVTPVAQPGNDRPRLFRLVEDEAIINRMGFNNAGVDALVENVRRSRRNCVLGINIGKNKATPLENAVDDYAICMRKVYALADYITINISSPNTPGLRELQHGEGLSSLLAALKEIQAELAAASDRYVPLVVKIAPDLSDDEITDIAQRLLAAGIDGVIATNTTNSRPDYLHNKALAAEQGGLSGRPVFAPSNQVLEKLLDALDGQLPVIAVGGIFSAEDAREKIRLGASLVQIYTGFIYQGPKLVHDCAVSLAGASADRDR